MKRIEARRSDRARVMSRMQQVQSESFALEQDRQDAGEAALQEAEAKAKEVAQTAKELEELKRRRKEAEAAEKRAKEEMDEITKKAAASRGRSAVQDE